MKECAAVEEEKYSEWRVKDALRTLTDAENIKKDIKMMNLIQKELSKQKDAYEMAKLTIDEVIKLQKENSEKFKKWAKENK